MTSAASIQNYARLAGALMLVTIAAGYFGEAYVPSKIIVGKDAAATAHNLATFSSLFRVGFASYLVEAICDVILAWLFYIILRPVHPNLALLTAFFGVLSTAVYAVAELSFFSGLVILRSAEALRAFSPEQLDALVFLTARIFGHGGWIFLAFYGIPSALRGYLILRSGYLPAWLGALFAIGGLGFIGKNVAVVLAPAYASDALLLPMAIAGIALTGWLLVKGVDVEKWRAAEERAALPGHV